MSSSHTHREPRSSQPRPFAHARLIPVVVLALAVAGCADTTPETDASGIVVTDPTGRQVRLDGPARRVVSMMPAATEWLVAMGGADRLVARTDYDLDPALQSLPSVGGGLSPSLEWIAARRPDLVIAWPDGPARSTIARLGALRIPAYLAPAETVEEGFAIASDLGRLVGLEAAADSAVAATASGLDRVRDQVRDRPRPEVLFLIGLEPLTAAGPGTFLDQLLGIAGGRNALADLGIHWPALSLEEVVRRDPDVILIGDVSALSAEQLAGRAGWRDVAAVRAGRVHAVDPYAVNRWGPRMHESAALLAGLIHPEVRP